MFVWGHTQGPVTMQAQAEHPQNKGPTQGRGTPWEAVVRPHGGGDTWRQRSLSHQLCATGNARTEWPRLGGRAASRSCSGEPFRTRQIPNQDKCPVDDRRPRMRSWLGRCGRILLIEDDIPLHEADRRDRHTCSSPIDALAVLVHPSLLVVPFCGV